MSLNIDTSACVGQDPMLNFPVACAMMVCGVPDLKTQDDADELFVRYRMFVMSDNALVTGDYLTHKQISKFVGCTTNVSKLTPLQFNKVVAHRLREASTSIMNRQKKEQDALLP